MLANPVLRNSPEGEAIAILDSPLYLQGVAFASVFPDLALVQRVLDS